MSDIIEWHQAQEIPKENRKSQELAIAQFLEEDCAMHNGRDLQHFSNVTGKDLDWIIENGKNINAVIKEIYYLEGSLDAVWDF